MPTMKRRAVTALVLLGAILIAVSIGMLAGWGFAMLVAGIECVIMAAIFADMG